jgi:hypothetical protein
VADPLGKPPARRIVERERPSARDDVRAHSPIL